MGAVLAILGVREQPDLLVVADRAGRRADGLRALAAPHDRTGSASGTRTCAGRISETPAPSSETAASTHKAVCMLWMKGASCWSDRPFARPEKILNSTSFGIDAATTAITNAIEMTAPVFCTITRVPAAMPRRAAGTVPIIAAVFGLLNIPEPMPTSSSQVAEAT